MADKVVPLICGIKCDFCDYRDESVPYENYPQYINRPCPCCGAPLLTEDDYAFCQTMMAYVEAINESDMPGSGEDTVVRFELNGTGKAKVYVENGNLDDNLYN